MTYSLSTCTRFSLLVCSCKNNEHTIHFPSLAACSLYKLQQHSQKYHQLTIDSYPWPQNFIIEKRGKIGTNLVNRDAATLPPHLCVNLFTKVKRVDAIYHARKEGKDILSEFQWQLDEFPALQIMGKNMSSSDRVVVRVTLAPHQWATTWRVKLL